MTRSGPVVRLAAVLLLIVPIVVAAGCVTPTAPIFSFVVFADPHITGNPDKDANLTACVNWVNANKDEKLIDLVFVVGDVGWGSGQAARARQILDGLAVPYVPLIGDNEIQSSYEEAFDTAFAPQYDSLATELQNWQKTPAPVWNPERGEWSYLENFSFDHKGVHFLGVDWATRVRAEIVGEEADLHDFAGGSWPWFVEDVTNAPKDLKENIVVLSHHPMHPMVVGSFSGAEAAQIENFTSAYADYVYASFAGHYHIAWHGTRALGGYEVYITPGITNVTPGLRVVGVHSDGTTLTYDHQLISVQ